MGYTEPLLSGFECKLRNRLLYDGICLAYMAWAPDPTMLNSKARAGAITGDLWHFCGYSWYLSGKTINGTILRCGWLDGDNSNGDSPYGVFLNTDVLGNGCFQSFAEMYLYPQDVCSWAISLYNGPPSGQNRRRSLPRDVFGNNAYLTSDCGAIDLCNSTTSWRPSILSLQEGVFRDMTTRVQVPLCKDGPTEGCMAYNSTRLNKRDLRGSHGTLTAVNVSQGALSH